MTVASNDARPASERLRTLVYALTLPWVAFCASGSESPHVYCYPLVVLALWSVLLGFVRQQRRVRWLRGIDLLLWNAVLAFLLFEAGTRAYLAWGSAPPWLILQPDQLRYRLDPQDPYLGFRPNSRGFHDLEFAQPKPPGLVRVVALGDSYAVGMVPYPEVYLTLVDDALGEGVEIANLGVVHIAVRQYLETLQTDGLALEPDSVLVGLFLGNDIRPDPRRGLLSPMGSRAVVALSRGLALLLPAKRASIASASAPFYDAPDGSRVELPLLSTDDYLDKEAKHLRRLFRPPRDDYMQTSWRDTEAALDELISLCRKRGIPVLATLAPDEIQVIPGLLERVAAARGLDPQEFDLEYPVRRLRGVLEARGVPVLDLAPALRAAEADAPTYHERAVHWNRHGNAVVARALGPWLRTRLAALGLPARRQAAHTRSFTSLTP